MDGEPKFEPATCVECGQAFERKSFQFQGRSLGTRHCPKCEVEVEAAIRRREAANRESATAHRWAAKCPTRFLDTNPSRLPQESLKVVLSWTAGDRGLLLHGPTRSGKTRAAWLLLERLFRMGVDARTFTAMQFSRASSDAGASGRGTEWAETLVGCRLLFIDDLGKGSLTERNEADLFDILDRRFANKLPVLMTMNIVGKEFEDSLSPDRGPALVRRLREFCDAVSFEEGENL